MPNTTASTSPTTAPGRQAGSAPSRRRRRARGRRDRRGRDRRDRGPHGRRVRDRRHGHGRRGWSQRRARWPWRHPAPRPGRLASRARPPRGAVSRERVLVRRPRLLRGRARPGGGGQADALGSRARRRPGRAAPGSRATARRAGSCPACGSWRRRDRGTRRRAPRARSSTNGRSSVLSHAASTVRRITSSA